MAPPKNAPQTAAMDQAGDERNAAEIDQAEGERDEDADRSAGGRPQGRRPGHLLGAEADAGPAPGVLGLLPHLAPEGRDPVGLAADLHVLRAGCLRRLGGLPRRPPAAAAENGSGAAPGLLSAAIDTAPHLPFQPVPVEEPGGARIQDRRPPAPEDLVEVSGHEGPAVLLHRLAATAWEAMVAAARADGIDAPLLLPVSGYRSSEEQDWLWRAALEKYGDPDTACLWVARPGTSAHQSGRAVDLHLGDPIESEYAEGMRTTGVYRWLVEHAVRFGFYPYDLEPWHWEYNPPRGRAGA